MYFSVLQTPPSGAKLLITMWKAPSQRQLGSRVCTFGHYIVTVLRLEIASLYLYRTEPDRHQRERNPSLNHGRGAKGNISNQAESTTLNIFSVTKTDRPELL